MKIDAYGGAALHVGLEVDSDDGALHLWADDTRKYTEVWLSPAAQDQLIAHLIEVRGAARVQELLNNPE